MSETIAHKTGNASRRSVITAALAATGAVGVPSARAAPSSPRPFVLVHGAWHGGWCWRRTADALTARGHRVFTPTLTGLGDRAHLRSAAVTLDTHIEDVVALLQMEDIRDAVLVGHSYAGMVVGGVVDRTRDRLGRLVLLDTLIPEDGRSLVEAAHVDLAPLRATAIDGLYLPPPPPSAFGIPATDAATTAWMTQRLRPHPLATWTERLTFRNGGLADLPASYIRCTSPPLPDTAMWAGKARTRGWPVYEIVCGHDAMVLEPERLADLLSRDSRL